MSQSDDDVVTRLLDSHTRRAISRFGGSLSKVSMAIVTRLDTQGSRARSRAHLEALRGHLVATGVAEDDAFLLRYALTVPGMFRGIVPPLMVLEPNRNGFSERRKREAGGQVNRLCEVQAALWMESVHRSRSRRNPR